MNSKKIEEYLKTLSDVSKEHLEKGLALMTAGNSKLYAMDLLCFAVYKRSMALIKGFTTMIKKNNFICAAPLIRLQLDNALRFQATFLVNDPNALFIGFINGTPIREFKDAYTKDRLTDAYLVKELEKKFPGIASVYKHTSGYVHLSEKHFFNLIKPIKGKADKKVEVLIGADDYVITDEDRIEATEAMIHISRIILWLLSGWTAKKNSL